jgi:hypothetical protein
MFGCESGIKFSCEAELEFDTCEGPYSVIYNKIFTVGEHFIKLIEILLSQDLCMVFIIFF